MTLLRFGAGSRLENRHHVVILSVSPDVARSVAEDWVGAWNNHLLGLQPVARQGGRTSACVY